MYGSDGPARVHMGSSLPFYLYSPLFYHDLRKHVHVVFVFEAFIFDFIILVFTMLGLNRQQAAQGSPLWQTLYRQGILYFIATTLVNIPLLVSATNALSFSFGDSVIKCDRSVAG